MDNRTKRDVTFLNLVSDFETNFEKGQPIVFDEKTFLEIIRFYEEELQYDKAIEVTDLALSQFSYRPDFYIIKARLLFQTKAIVITLSNGLLNRRCCRRAPREARAGASCNSPATSFSPHSP